MVRQFVAAARLSSVGMVDLASRWQIEKKADRNTLDTGTSTERE
jgi:hypothetical protein